MDMILDIFDNIRFVNKCVACFGRRLRRVWASFKLFVVVFCVNMFMFCTAPPADVSYQSNYVVHVHNAVLFHFKLYIFFLCLQHFFAHNGNVFFT